MGSLICTLCYANLDTEEEMDAHADAEVVYLGRRNSVSAEAGAEKRFQNYVKQVFEKSELDKDKLMNSLISSDKAAVLFSHLEESSLREIVDAFYPMDVVKDHSLIVQGDEGDRFYIVDSGDFDALISRNDGPAVKVAEYSAGGSFGELALMYNAPRAATVRCTSDTARVFAIDRESFQMLIMSSQAHKLEQYAGWLDSVPLLENLNHYERAKLSDLLKHDVWQAGEEVISEGDEGDKFYLLEEGALEVSVKVAGGHVQKVLDYTCPGDYFGEIALLSNNKRTATVKAVADSLIHYVTKEEFDLVIGPVREALQQGISLYTRPENAVTKLLA